jgi:hypothetical protein
LISSGGLRPGGILLTSIETHLGDQQSISPQS